MRLSYKRKKKGFDIWRFQRRLTKRLLLWAGFSIGIGLWQQQQRNRFWRGVAMQFISWGAINAGIALIGDYFTKRRKANHPKAYAHDTIQQEQKNLAKILWINTGLDILYIAGGIILAWTRGASDRLMRGNGWGIVIQGGFLFIFDLIHVLMLNTHEGKD